MSAFKYVFCFLFYFHEHSTPSSPIFLLIDSFLLLTQRGHLRWFRYRRQVHSLVHRWLPPLAFILLIPAEAKMAITQAQPGWHGAATINQPLTFQEGALWWPKNEYFHFIERVLFFFKTGSCVVWSDTRWERLKCKGLFTGSFYAFPLAGPLHSCASLEVMDWSTQQERQTFASFYIIVFLLWLRERSASEMPLTRDFSDGQIYNNIQ